MVEGVEFFALGEAALHPASEEVARREEICERTADGGHGDKERAAPESVNCACAKAQHGTGKEEHAGERVEDDEPNPADGTGLFDPDHRFARPGCPLIKHGKGAPIPILRVKASMRLNLRH